MGFKIVRMNPLGNATDSVIVNYTKKFTAFDPDSVVIVDFNVGGYIRFANALTFFGAVDPDPTAQPEDRPTLTSVSWDPPGETRPPRGVSQATTFDNAPLSAREEGYQDSAVNWFILYVLADYLAPRHYFIDPTPDVLAVMHAIDPERPPETLDDIMEIVRHEPELIKSVRCVEEAFRPESVSPAMRRVIRQLLENRETVQMYLSASPDERGSLVEGWTADGGGELPPRERYALVQGAEDRGELFLSAYDSVELGRGPGDESTYILIGTELGDLRLLDPDQKPGRFDAWRWVVDQLDEFEDLNGFLPAFGPYVTEARMRYRVILGPGVSEREAAFLRFYGHETIDRRSGEPIGKLESDVAPME